MNIFLSLCINFVLKKLGDNLLLLTLTVPNRGEICLIQWLHIVYDDLVYQKRLQHTVSLLKMFPDIEFNQDEFGKEMVSKIDK